uniref:Uncharacterized protein n=1 Tax=Monopterus albus TaxID=43700 RepID=A0A3Q3K482_MONAL
MLGQRLIKNEKFIEYAINTILEDFKISIFNLFTKIETICHFHQQKKCRRGSIELSRIRCVEIVKNRGGFIPCQNKYPFQVSWTLKVLHSPVGETAPSCILLTCSAF